MNVAATRDVRETRLDTQFERERTTFIPRLLAYTMRYINRNSGIQQIVSSFGAARAGTGR
jgi:hypothetical protein